MRSAGPRMAPGPPLPHVFLTFQPRQRDAGAEGAGRVGVQALPGHQLPGPSLPPGRPQGQGRCRERAQPVHREDRGAPAFPPELGPTLARSSVPAPLALWAGAEARQEKSPQVTGAKSKGGAGNQPQVTQVFLSPAVPGLRMGLVLRWQWRKQWLLRFCHHTSRRGASP